MESLAVLAILVVLSGPVLAILALVAVRKLENSSSFGSQIHDLTSRVYELERRIKDLNSVGAEPLEEAHPGRSTVVKEPSIQELVQVHLPAEPDSSAGTPPPPAISTASSLQRSGPTPGASAGRTGAGDWATPPTLEPKVGDRSGAELDLESRIAGRWFSRVGIVALLFSVSYFLKWAFDNNWIGPSGRVAIGILLGALMLPWSQWLLGRGYAYFSEGIVALGEATLFVSVWAGCQYYTLYSRDVGFFAMIAITAVMAAIAIGRNSQRIAVLSLLGGLLTPVLASSGKNQQVVLFTYLLVLGTGALAIQWKKNWASLVPIMFVGAQVYFWGWYSEFFASNSPVERTVVFATLFFLLFAMLPVSRALSGAGFGVGEILLLLMNPFAYSIALFVLLWPADKWPLTLLFLALAAAHVAIARVSPEPREDQNALPRLLYAGLALTFLTLAIPIRLEGNSITLSLAVEAAVLIWTGFRAANNFLRRAGYLLLAIASLRLVILPPDGGMLFFNARFGAYLVLIGCFTVALWSARKHASKVDGSEQVEVAFFAVVINLCALLALSLEFWDFFGKTSTGIDGALAQHLSLSVLWTIYASALLFAGIKSVSALLRWQGLVLFGAVMGKVFLYDLSFLNRGYRILSFFVLGAVLLAVSFYYTRKITNQKGAA